MYPCQVFLSDGIGIATATPNVVKNLINCRLRNSCFAIGIDMGIHQITTRNAIERDGDKNFLAHVSIRSVVAMVVL